MRDMVIIGAGPAGCTAAILLARAGFDVSIIEQHRFPRDKVCGECISALGTEVAARLGINLVELGAVKLKRAILLAPSGALANIDLPKPMWGLSRARFDEILLEQAQQSGAKVIQPARCESITPGTRPIVDVRDLITNRVRQIS